MTSFRDRLVFDAERGEYRDGEMRYMMIRPDALMGMIAEMPEKLRPEALKAFVRSVRRFGGRSAASYRAAGALDDDALLRTIEATAPQLGWGVWKLVRTDLKLSLTVENSPFAAGMGKSDYPICAPIRGMLMALGEQCMFQAVRVEETACAAAGAPNCEFTAVPFRGPDD